MGDKIVRVLKKNLVAIITIVISMGVLLYFLFTTDGITALGHLVSSMRWEWLLITLGAMVGGWLLETYVLGVFCKHLYPKWKFSQSFHIAMTGLLYSALTPFATGGQPMQMYSMSKMGMDTGKAGSIVAMKTLVYQALMVVYAMVMVIFRLGYFQRKIRDVYKRQIVYNAVEYGVQQTVFGFVRELAIPQQCTHVDCEWSFP